MIYSDDQRKRLAQIAARNKYQQKIDEKVDAYKDRLIKEEKRHLKKGEKLDAFEIIHAHQSEIEAYSDTLRSSIAPILGSSLNNSIYGPTTSIFAPASVVKKTGELPPPSAPEVLAAFSSLTPEELSGTFTSGKSRDISGHGFYYQKTARTVEETPDNVIRAFKNISAKGGVSYLWDLETFGGNIDPYGHNLGQRVTEYAFVKAKGDVRKGGYKTGEVHNSVIGLTEEEFHQNESIIKKLQNGEDLTMSEKVTLQRLMLHGHESTKLDTSMASRGIFRFSSFADKEDIAGTAAEAIRGNKLLRDIGISQERERLSRGANAMFGWEEDMLSALRDIVSNDYTAIGHNTSGFDIFNLSRFIQNAGVTTKEFRDNVAEVFGGHLSFNNNLDDIQLLKQFGTDRIEYWLDYFGGDVQKTNLYFKTLKEIGETNGTQTAILMAQNIRAGKNPMEKIGDGVAHVAITDTINTGALAYSGDLYNTVKADSMIAKGEIGKALALKANGTQLFYATNSSWNPQKSGMISFTLDNMTGEWRSSDGVTIGKDGVYSEGFGAAGIRRRAMYTIDGMGRIEKGSPIYDAIGKAHPNLDVGNLVYIKYTPFSDSRTSAAKSPVVHVGTKEDVMKFLNKNMILAATRKNTKSPDWNLTDMAKRELSLITTLHGGATAGLSEEAPTLQKLKDISTYTFDNDTAARLVRQADIAKDRKILRYADDMKSYTVEQYATDETKRITQKLGKGHAPLKADNIDYENLDTDIKEKYRRRFFDEVDRRTKQVAAMVTAGKPIKLGDPALAGTFYDYFGYTDYKNPGALLPTISSNVVTNNTQAVEYVEKNRGIITAAYDKAIELASGRSSSEVEWNDLTPNQKNEARGYYRMLLTRLEQKAIEKRNDPYIAKSYELNKTATGFKLHPRVKAEVENTFQIDISGFRKDVPEGNVVSIKLDNSGMGIADSIYRKLGVTNSLLHDKRRYPDQRKISLLADFQKFLGERGIIDISPSKEGTFDYAINPAEDGLDIASQKLLHGLREARKANPKAGFLLPSEQHDVVDIPYENIGLTQEEIQAEIDRPLSRLRIFGSQYMKPKMIGGKPTWSENPEFSAMVEEAADTVHQTLYDIGDRASTVDRFMGIGLSRKDAEHLADIEIAKKNADYDFTKAIVGGIMRNGGAIQVDTTTGGIYAASTAEEVRAGKWTQLDFGREVWANGGYASDINGVHYLNPFGLRHIQKFNGDESIQATTSVDKFYQEKAGLIDFMLDKGGKQGNVADMAQTILRQVNGFRRSVATADSSDLVDARNMHAITVGDVGSALHLLKNTEAVKGIKNDGSDEYDDLIRLLSGELPEKEAPLKDMGFAEASAVRKYLSVLTQGALEVVTKNGDVARETIGNATAFNVLSHGGNTAGIVGIVDDLAMDEYYTANTNHINEKAAHSALINTETPEAKELAKRDAWFGTPIRTKYEVDMARSESDRIGAKLDNVVSVRRVSGRSEDFRKLMAEYLTDEEKDTYAGKLLMSRAYTEEGSALGSTWLAEGALDHRFYDQSVRVSQVADSQNTSQGFTQRLRDAASTIQYDKDGNLVYKSSPGSYVKNGQFLFNRRMGSDYPDEAVKAKYDGLLRMGVFRNGYLVSDKTVTEKLNEHKQEIEASGKDWESAAYRVLSNDPELSLRYYVDDPTTTGHIKTANDLEKNTLTITSVPLGKGDSRVAGTLKAMGAGSLIGADIKSGIFEELKEADKAGQIRSSRLMILIENTRKETIRLLNKGRDKKDLLKYKPLTTAEITEAIKNSGIDGGISGFVSAMEQERHQADELMNVVFRRAGLITDGQYIHVVENSSPGVIKHLNSTVAQQVAYRMLEDPRYGSGDKVAAKLSEFIPGISYDPKRGIVFDPTVKKDFNLSGLQKFADETYGIDKTFSEKAKGADNLQRMHDTMHTIRYGDGTESLFEVAQSAQRRFTDYDVPHYSSDGTYEIKFDNRMLSNMQMNRYSEQYLGKVAPRYLEGALGKEKGKLVYDKYVSGIHADDLTQRRYYDQVMEHMFYTDKPGDHSGKYGLVYDGSRPDFKPSDKTMDTIRELGYSDSQIGNMVESMKKEGAGKISADKVTEYLRAFSYSTAARFNVNKEGKREGYLTPENLRKMGWNEVNIDDLDIDPKNSVERGFKNSIFGQQTLINLHSDKLEKLGLGDVFGADYIALPHGETGMQDNTGSYVSEEYQKKLRTVVRQTERLEDDFNHLDPQEIARRKGQIRSAVSDLRDSISQSASNKKGVIKEAATAHLTDDVMYLTAHGHQFYGNGLDGDWSNMRFLDTGINFSQQAGMRGAHAEALGRYEDALLADKNGSTEETKEALKSAVSDLNASPDGLELDYAVINERSAMQNFYSNERFLKLAGGNKELAEEMRARTQQYLKTNGTISTLIRHPAQSNHSVRPTALYLSDQVKSGEFVVNSRAWGQMNGDFDSDKGFINIQKANATIDYGNGKTVNADVDFATYNTLRDMGVNVQLSEKDKDLFDQAKSAMLQQSMEVNNIYEPRNSAWAQDSLSSGSLASTTWDGEHLVDLKRHYTPEEVDKFSKAYYDTSLMFRNHLISNGMTEQQVSDMVGTTAYRKQMRRFVEENDSMDTEAKNTALEGMRYNQVKEVRYAQAVESVSKKGAGPLNKPLFELQRLVQTANNVSYDTTGHHLFNAQEMYTLNTAILAASENTLSGKNGGGNIDTHRVEKLNSAINGMISSARTGDKDQIAAAAGTLSDTVLGIVSGRKNKELSRIIAYDATEDAARSGVNKGVLTDPEETFKNIEALMKGLPKRITTSGMTSDAFKLSVSMAGINSSREISSIEEAKAFDPTSSVSSVVNENARRLGGNDVIRMTKPPRPSSLELASESRHSLEEQRRNIRRGMERNRRLTSASEIGTPHFSKEEAEPLRQAIRRIASMNHSGGRSGLGAAAIGIAGGLLTAGYAAGPSARNNVPADHATGASENEQANVQAAPSLSDSNMNVMRGGPNSGYIININASSPQGAQMAQKAIMTAASGMTPQNGSINLSIDNSVSDQINQLQINRMVSNAIGLSG